MILFGFIIHELVFFVFLFVLAYYQFASLLFKEQALPNFISIEQLIFINTILIFAKFWKLLFKLLERTYQKHRLTFDSIAFLLGIAITIMIAQFFFKAYINANNQDLVQLILNVINISWASSMITAYFFTHWYTRTVIHEHNFIIGFITRKILIYDRIEKGETKDYMKNFLEKGVIPHLSPIELKRAERLLKNNLEMLLKRELIHAILPTFKRVSFVFFLVTYGMFLFLFMFLKPFLK